MLGLMKLEAVGRTAKTVGQKNVGPGINELLMQKRDTVGVIGIPEFRRIAGLKP